MLHIIIFVWLRTGSNPADSNRFRSHTGKHFKFFPEKVAWFNDNFWLKIRTNWQIFTDIISKQGFSSPKKARVTINLPHTTWKKEPNHQVSDRHNYNFLLCTKDGICQKIITLNKIKRSKLVYRNLKIFINIYSNQFGSFYQFENVRNDFLFSKSLTKWKKKFSQSMITIYFRKFYKKKERVWFLIN